MKMKQLTERYSLKQEIEAVQAFEHLLNSKEELEEKADIQPMFKTYPVLIPMMADLVGMSRMDIDESGSEFRLWNVLICDLGFANSKENTYCFIELEDAKKNSIFLNEPKNYPKFSRRFEVGQSQIFDWIYKIDELKNNATSIEQVFATHNPTIITILIIGRTSFLNPSEKTRLKWRTDRTIIDSKKIHCLTYDDLLNYYQNIIKRKQAERLLDMEQETIMD